ncbi:Probable cytochrome c oxidase polypeptide 4 [Actinomycetales bacterium JB111]|nr:Probable cytochrome c oxidase polypeptide 4 [Actinomycetales bacterium JB111]
MTAQQPDGSQVTAVGTTETQTRIRPLHAEIVLFVWLTVFFLVVAIAYMLVADYEPVGTTALFLSAGLNGFTGAYLWLTARRTTPEARWEDNPNGEIADRTGDLGEFSPGSWWPLVLGFAVTLGFLGPAVGWWMTGLGLIVALVGLAGQMYEFNRGIHAH